MGTTLLKERMVALDNILIEIVINKGTKDDLLRPKEKPKSNINKIVNDTYKWLKTNQKVLKGYL